EEAQAELEQVDGVLVPGGFGSRGWEGKILACRVARERGIPYLGICLGMHVAVSEYARHVVGLEGANSTEMDPETPYPVIDLLPDHPWFVASQFHPEFKSRPTRPAPLFREFLGAALARSRERVGAAYSAGA